MIATKILICVTIAALFVGCVKSEIRSTAILFRHGERTPLRRYPNLRCDLCDEIGMGELTNVGVRQSYENGLRLRDRYKHLFPKEGYYRATNMRVVCSVPGRTVMSLQSFMAAFFPPPPTNSNLPIAWQPFPFHMDYPGRKVHRNRKPKLCPVFFKNFDYFIENPPADLMAWKVADQKVLNETVNILGTNETSLLDILQIQDALVFALSKNPDIPQSIVDAYHNTIKKYSVVVYREINENDIMIKIQGGPILTEILTNMEAIAKGDRTGRNLLIYSGHDSSIASLANAMRVIDQLPTLISSTDTLLVDLIENVSGEFSVEVIYLDNANSDSNVINLDVPGCGKSCSLATFREAVKNFIVEDIDKLCGL